VLAGLLLSLLTLPGTLSGWLVDPDGVRIEGAVLDFEPLDGQPPARFAADPTDASGAWTMDGLAPGRWRPSLRRIGPGVGAVHFWPAELLVPSLPRRLEVSVAHVSIDAGPEIAFCVQAPDRERTLERGERLPDLHGGRNWLVRRDARSVVGLWCRRRGLAEVELRLGFDDPWGACLRPSLPQVQSPPGRVELIVPRATGVSVELALLAPRSRHELERVDAELGPSGPTSRVFRLTLPPGDYLLRVEEPDPASICLVGLESTWERRSLRAIELDVNVASGSQQRLEREWEDGVRPTLRFDAPGASSVFLWELDERGRITRPVGCEPHARGLVFGDLLAWPDGIAHAAREPLPLGRVRLLAGADGFAPREFELELVAGEPCEARIALSALER
jgi:hypothetical protein